mmetsp:Transcript_22702/g.65328  ORF Transcript_22702/g.65328 Transcript_22702/m.65328 type:complete len:323 (-) Transcript_22702:110-1078(-)
MAAALLATCRRRLAVLPPSYRCGGGWCRRRMHKAKSDEDSAKVGKDDVADLEMGDRAGTISGTMSLLAEPVLANGQDADERVGALGAAEVPSWQMPKLVVECSQRPGARIYRGTSVMLPDAGGDLLAGIVTNLPTLLQLKPCWHLGYSMAVDGVSLQTMYRHAGETGPCLLVIEDSSNCIFGAFLPGGLRIGSRCDGTHECFVFRYPRAAGAWRTQVYSMLQTTCSAPRPFRDNEPQGEHWANYHEALRKCQAWSVAEGPMVGAFCDSSGIVVGLDGPALFVDQNLLRGVSWPSAAFGSPCLAASGPEFVVRNLEVWRWASP